MPNYDDFKKLSELLATELQDEGGAPSIFDIIKHGASSEVYNTRNVLIYVQSELRDNGYQISNDRLATLMVEAEAIEKWDVIYSLQQADEHFSK